MMDPDAYFRDAERLWLERLARERQPPRRAPQPRRAYRAELLPGGCVLYRLGVYDDPPTNTSPSAA
jgi:hypothetical protein